MKRVARENVTEFPDQDLDGGGGGGTDGRLRSVENRLIVIETEMKRVATTENITELKNWILKTALAVTGGLLLTIVSHLLIRAIGQ